MQIGTQKCTRTHAHTHTSYTFHSTSNENERMCHCEYEWECKFELVRACVRSAFHYPKTKWALISFHKHNFAVVVLYFCVLLLPSVSRIAFYFILLFVYFMYFIYSIICYVMYVMYIYICLCTNTPPPRKCHPASGGWLLFSPTLHPKLQHNHFSLHVSHFHFFFSK